MEIRFTKHALLRLFERDLTPADVVTVLEHYHTLYTDRKGNPNYVGAIDSRSQTMARDIPLVRRVRVVVARDSDPPLVITVIVNTL